MPLGSDRGTGFSLWSKGTKGAALLTVLWLCAALGAIAFSLANTVRGETERASAAIDGLRAYYLATGAVERALLQMEWSPVYRNDDGSPRYFGSGLVSTRFDFPTGEAFVELLPEAGKLGVNDAAPEDLHRLLLALGADPGRAHEIVLAIVDWRTQHPEDAVTPFDQHYLSLNPSFRARHASFQEIEELLLVKGMTPELFYGTYERGPDGRLVPRGGLRDCLTVYPTETGDRQVDVNTAEPAVLAAIGFEPNAIAAIVEARRRAPLRDLEPVRAFGPAANRLRIGGRSIYTIRATARIRRPDGGLGEDRRSVAATVKWMPPNSVERFNVLRWQENVWPR